MICVDCQLIIARPLRESLFVNSFMARPTCARRGAKGFFNGSLIGNSLRAKTAEARVFP